MLFNNNTMKEVDSRYYREIKFKDDCKLIQSICNKNKLELSLIEIQELYKNYSSDNYCSSWESGIEYISEQNIYKIMKFQLIKLVNDRLNRWSEIKLNFDEENINNNSSKNIELEE